MRKSFVVLFALMMILGVGAADAQKGSNNMPIFASNAKGQIPGAGGVRSTPDAFVAVDITGVQSWDALDDPSNTVLQEVLGVGAIMTGIGWDVTLETQGGSWLSEAVTYFDGSDLDGTGLFLTVGVGDGFPGTATYSSGGIIDLTDNAIPDIPILADGTLYMQFYESFDDADNAVDATYLADSTYDIAIIAGEPVPALPVVGLIVLMVLVLGLGMHFLKRRQQVLVA